MIRGSSSSSSRMGMMRGMGKSYFKLRLLLFMLLMIGDWIFFLYVLIW